MDKTDSSPAIDAVEDERAQSQQSADDDVERRGEGKGVRPACFNSTIQEVLFVLTATSKLTLSPVVSPHVANSHHSGHCLGLVVDRVNHRHYILCRPRLAHDQCSDYLAHIRELVDERRVSTVLWEASGFTR